MLLRQPVRELMCLPAVRHPITMAYMALILCDDLAAARVGQGDDFLCEAEGRVECEDSLARGVVDDRRVVWVGGAPADVHLGCDAECSAKCEVQVQVRARAQMRVRKMGAGGVTFAERGPRPLKLSTRVEKQMSPYNTIKARQSLPPPVTAHRLVTKARSSVPGPP